MFAAGLRPEDFDEDAFAIWPENQESIALFSSLSTQWRMGGMGGPTGFDYNVLFARMAQLGLTGADHERLFQDIRVIESEALQLLNNRDS